MSALLLALSQCCHVQLRCVQWHVWRGDCVCKRYALMLHVQSDMHSCSPRYRQTNAAKKRRKKGKESLLASAGAPSTDE